MSDESRQQYEKCLGHMLDAARKWISERPGVAFAVRLPPEDTFVIGALDDSTIALLSLDAVTAAFLKELERAADVHGGATIMQAVEILRAIGPMPPLSDSTKAKVN